MVQSSLHQRFRLCFRDVRRIRQAAAIGGTFLFVVVLAVVPSCADETSAALAKPFKPVIGAKFDDALDQPLGVTWTDESLRQGLRRLAEAKQVSIWLDRRIDPETKVSLDVQRVPFRDLLREVSRQQELGLGLSIVHNVVYIGPMSTTARLRTVIEQQSDRLAAGVMSTNKPPIALQQRRSIHWEDLDRPADIVARIGELFSVEVENLALIPHDLWVAGSIPNATATEMLMLIASQFELAIEWQPKTWSVRFVPMPNAPVVERTYDLKTRAAEVVREWQAEFTDLDIALKVSKATVRATVEQHEELAASLKQARSPTRTNPPKNTGTKAIAFTFEIKAAPLIDIMKAVEKQSTYTFEFDAEQLKAAGIKLDRRLDLKMTKASPSELFHAMFDDSKIAFKVDGTTVRLSPAE